MTRSEFNKVVDQWSDNVYRFVLKLVRNEMTAQDMVQEAFEKMWLKHEHIDPAKAKSYLFTTAHHTVLNFFQKEKRNGDIEMAQEPSETNKADQFDLKGTLDEALNTLPEIQKTVILLRDYEGYNYEEIGEITGLSESQVKVYIFRARKTLKNYLQRIELVI